MGGINANPSKDINKDVHVIASYGLCYFLRHQLIIKLSEFNKFNMDDDV